MISCKNVRVFDFSIVYNCEINIYKLIKKLIGWFKWLKEVVVLPESTIRTFFTGTIIDVHKFDSQEIYTI